jgi:hypothetical protein
MTATANGEHQRSTAPKGTTHICMTVMTQHMTTWDMSGLKSERSSDSAVPLRTWPTYYVPVSPSCHQ